MFQRIAMKSAILAITFALSLAAHASANELKTVSVPPGDLAKALRVLADQVGIEFIYQSDQVRGLRTDGVSGDYSARDAVIKLLEGTQLQLRTDDESGALLISQPIASTAVSTTGSIDGDQSDSLAGASNERVDLNEILITGTRIRGGRTASPVRSIESKEIEQSGASSTQQFIATLPENWGGGATEFTASAGILNSSTLHNIGGDVGANLHGLGSQATLVLLNGRRLAPAGRGTFVDISMLPLSAIERIDVLTDGASALYGSDAVGGVLNFILRDDLSGGDALVEYGGVTDGAHDRTRISLSYGANWKSGRGIISLDYDDQSALPGSDRDFVPASAANMTLTPDLTRKTFLATGEQDVADRLTLSGDVFFSDKDSQFIGADTSSSDNSAQQVAIALSADYEFSPIWSTSLAANWSRNELDTVASIFGFTFFDTTETYDSSSLSALVNGRLFALPGGHARFAGGIEYREEELRSDDRLAGTNTITGKREVGAVFGEIELPLVGQNSTLPLVRELTVTAAVRSEDYDDFGETTNPKFGIRWRPVEGVLLRATTGDSFRAPSLVDVTGFGQAVLLNVPDVPGPLTPSLVLFGFQEGLGPETSTTDTVGIDLTPSQSRPLRISVTYFRTLYDNRIQTPSPDFTSMLINEAQFADLITRDPTLTQLNEVISQQDQFLDPFGIGVDAAAAIIDNQVQNIAAVDVTGVDFNAVYSISTDRAVWSFDTAVTNIISYEQSLTPTSSVVDVDGTTFNPPDWRARLSSTYQTDKYSLTGAVNFVSSYVDTTVSPAGDVADFTTLDLRAALSLGEFWRNAVFADSTLSVALINVFDEDPPRIANAAAGYDATNASPLGRTFAVQLRMRW